MRIEDRNAISESTAARTSDVEQAHAASGRGSNSLARLGGDSVELSGASIAVRSFNTAHEVKLQQLAKSVQSGSYAVNPSLTSRALVAEAIAGGRN